MTAQQDAPALTAWGRCLGCGVEGHLDTRTGLCATCQAFMPRVAAHPAAPHHQHAPHGQPALPHPYPYPPPTLLPGHYPNPYPSVPPGQYPTYDYAGPYVWGYPYPTKSPQRQSAETMATMGAVLCLIGLVIVFPFGYITAPLAAIGLALCFASYRQGVHWALWGIVFAIAVLVAGIIGVAALFAFPHA